MPRTDAIDRREVQRLRQSILKWAFECKLVDQCPATELLKRIKAARKSTATTSRGQRKKHKEL